MIHLIDKDALVAEIERRIKLFGSKNYKCTDRLTVEERLFTLNSIKEFIETLEVKEEFKIGETQIYLEDDGGEPPYDGKQWLDLSCTEYEIPEDKFKDGDKVELIIRKAQKGE